MGWLIQNTVSSYSTILSLRREPSVVVDFTNACGDNRCYFGGANGGFLVLYVQKLLHALLRKIHLYFWIDVHRAGVGIILGSRVHGE